MADADKENVMAATCIHGLRAKADRSAPANPVPLTDEEKARRYRWWRCFWTWPLGHAWRDHNGRMCVGCGKSQRWVYDGMGGGWETR